MQIHWGVWIAILLLFVLVAKNYGAPWLVRRISSNVRIRNIGLRSVRGFFLKIGSVTLTADRIALTVHRTRGWLRVGLDVQNVVVNLQKEKTVRTGSGWATVRDHYSKSFSISSLAEVLNTRNNAPQHAKAWVLHNLIQWVRAIARFTAISCLSTVLRWLPTLTQSFDIHADQIVIVFEDLVKSHIVIKDATLATVAKFAKIADGDGDDGDELGTTKTVPLAAKPAKPTWRTKWKGSMQRVWESATAHTTGFISLTIDIDNIVAYTRPFTQPLLSEYRAQSRMYGATLTPTAGATGFTSVERSAPPDSVLSVDGPAHCRMSFGFSPQGMVFRRRTAEAVIHLPDLHVTPHAILELMKLLKTTAEEAAPVSEPFSSPWSPITRSMSPPLSPTRDKPQKAVVCTAFLLASSVC